MDSTQSLEAYFSVYFWQLPPFLSAGVKQPEMKYLFMPPPCLQQRPLRRARVVQHDTEHDLPFFPPCLGQC